MTRPDDPVDGLVAIPVRAREEIGELAFYLEQALRHLREVDSHLRDSSQTVPDVLDVLREINRMTEAAAVRVLEEAEALVEDGSRATALVADIRSDAGAEPGAADPRLEELDALVARSAERSMAIMGALEFQDLTAQKVHRALTVLGEVVERLRRVQGLVFREPIPVAGLVPTPAEPARSDGVPGKSGQALADELLESFTGQGVDHD
jgi:chemotaxis regulatin CheY-phosphate phosphatase CheZ